MSCVEMDRALEAWRRGDLGGVRKHLVNVALAPHEDFRIHVLARGLEAEIPAAAETATHLLVRALRALRRRVGGDAPQGDALADLHELCTPDDATLATRWIVLAEEGARRPELFPLAHGRYHDASIMIPGWAQDRPPPPDASRGSGRLISALCKRFFDGAAIDATTLASLACHLETSAAITSFMNGLWPLESARRLAQANGPRSSVAAALVMAAYFANERLTPFPSGTLARLALEYADPDSCEAVHARRLVAAELRSEVAACLGQFVVLIQIDDEMLVRVGRASAELAAIGDTRGFLEPLEAFVGQARDTLQLDEGRRVLARLRADVPSVALELDALGRCLDAAAPARLELDGLVAAARHLGTEIGRAQHARAQHAREAVEASRGAPVAGRVLTPFARELSVFAPSPRWHLMSAAAEGDAVSMEYVGEGESLTRWATLLTVTRHSGGVEGRLAAMRDVQTQFWTDQSLGGRVSVLESERVSPGLLLPYAEVVDRYAICVEGAPLSGDRYELEVVARTDKRFHTVRMSFRGADSGARFRRTVADGEPFTKARIDPQTLRSDDEAAATQRAGLAMAELIQQLDALSRRHARACMAVATTAVRAELANPRDREAYAFVSGLASRQTTDVRLAAGCGTVEEVRQRFEWLRPGSSAAALALEELAWASTRQPSEIDDEGRVRILARAARAYADQRDVVGAVRAMRVLRRLAGSAPASTRRSSQLKELLEAGNALLREGVNPRVKMLLFVELIKLIGLGGWGIDRSQALELTEMLRGNGRAMAAEARVADAAAAMIDEAVGTVATIGSNPTLVEFAGAEPRSLIEGGPVCEFTHGPAVQGVYLRPLASVNALRIPHRLEAETLAKLRRLPQFEAADHAISLEGALSVCLAPIPFMSEGGEGDGVGVWRITVTDETWKQAVEVLLQDYPAVDDGAMPQRCRVIFMVPARSEGVRWELATLRRLNRIPETYFVMPPAAIGEDVEGAWTAGRADFTHATGCEFPAFRPDGGFFRFNADGSLAEVVSFDDLWNGRFVAGILHRLGDAHGRMHMLYLNYTHLAGRTR